MKTMTMAVPTNRSFARQLFTRGTDFFDIAEVNKVFGTELQEDAVPPIPFTDEEVIRARELGQFLALHIPITMKGVHDGLKNKLGDGKLLYDTEWYKKEEFYTSETQEFEWRLTSGEVIPGSTGEDYLGQTQVIADYVQQSVYREQELPRAYAKAIEEFESQKEDLGNLLNADWKKAAEKLSSLKLNQLFREAPVQVLYRTALYFGVNNERLLESTRAWTKTRSSFGDLVSVGDFDRHGARVGGWGPDRSRSDVGVCFSRSSVPLESCLPD